MCWVHFSINILTSILLIKLKITYCIGHETVRRASHSASVCHSMSSVYTSAYFCILLCICICVQYSTVDFLSLSLRCSCPKRQPLVRTTLSFSLSFDALHSPVQLINIVCVPFYTQVLTKHTHARTQALDWSFYYCFFSLGFQMCVIFGRVIITWRHLQPAWENRIR